MFGEEYLAWFSSAGPTHDLRMKPEVIAPGYYIRSAESRPDKVGECDEQDGDGVDGLMYSAGTSMAAPIVAGTAALIRQYFEEGWYPSGAQVSADSLQPSSSLVKAVLINGAQPLVGRQQKDLTESSSYEYDEHQGFGAITLIDSLPLAGKNQLQSIVVDRNAIENGEEHVNAVTIDNSSGCSAPLSATLVWADPPGVPNCAACLLNDLDLEVVKAGQSTTYYPNGRSDPDTVNNVERVRINDASDGSVYIVRVKGTNLESSSQDYSLVITGCLGETVSNVSNEKTTKQVQQTQQQGMFSLGMDMSSHNIGLSTDTHFFSFVLLSLHQPRWNCFDGRRGWDGNVRMVGREQG
jgi:subtilisin family serine protease